MDSDDRRPTAPPHRQIAVAADGSLVAIRDQGRLRLVPTDRGEARAIELSGDADFAVIGGAAWVVADGAIARLTPENDALIAATPLPLSSGRLRFDRSGCATVADRLLVRAGPAGFEIEELPFQPRAGAAVAPVAGRLVELGSRVRMLTFSGEVLFDAALGNAVATRGYGILGDRALAVWARRPQDSAILVLGPQGRCVRSIGVARAIDLAVAEDAGIAILATDDQSLMAFDLRMGKLMATAPAPMAVTELAITARGDRIILAGSEEPGRLSVLEVSFDELFRPSGRTPANEDGGNEPPAPTSNYGPVELAAPEAPAAVPAPPRVPFRAPGSQRSAARPGDRDQAQAIIDQALCHSALVYERLIYYQRNLGLMPRTSTDDDPLGPVVVSDSDVATILAGFRRIGATPLGERPGLVPDTHAEALAASRARLLAMVEEEVAAVGIARLIRAFGLTDAAIDVLLLAIGPDWDLRIARLAGFLNNDLTRRRPTLGHAVMAAQTGLPVTGCEPMDRIERRLLRTGLLEQVEGAGAPESTREVRVPHHLVALSISLLEDAAPHTRWNDLCWLPEDRDSLRRALLRELHRDRDRRLVVLQGPPGSGRTAAAHATAADLGIGLVECDLSRLGDGVTARDQVSASAYRARLVGGALVIRWGEHDLELSWVSELVRRLEVPTFVVLGHGAIEGLSADIPFVRLEPPRLTPAGRRTLWQTSFAEVDLAPSDLVLDDLSGRYDVSGGRLRDVVRELAVRKAWDGSAQLSVQDVRETLREVTVQRLTNLATRYESGISLDDLLFPRTVRDRIAELVHRLRFRHRVLSGWGFADKAHESYGVSALFVGPPGTGKTAAAAAIANALDVDLYVVDFSRIMSKWVGETEQNLARVFDEAESSNVALLFDEADALFGKRSAEQKSSSDRYANLTVNYLLQRMESYSGLAILTTNLESAMDDAFQRRITTTVRFPPSTDELRQKLWQHLLPSGATLAPDVDLGELAHIHRMEGAHIRRALTRAAFRAAARGAGDPLLTQDDLLWAARAEYDDMGRLAFESQPLPRIIPNRRTDHG